MFKTRGGVKGRLNNVKKNCTIDEWWLPCIKCRDEKYIEFQDTIQYTCIHVVYNLTYKHTHIEIQDINNERIIRQKYSIKWETIAYQVSSHGKLSFRHEFTSWWLNAFYHLALFMLPAPVLRLNSSLSFQINF